MDRFQFHRQYQLMTIEQLVKSKWSWFSLTNQL